MKKSLIALAALATVATAAQAQSSVTIYGVLDAGIANTTGASGGTVTGLQNGILSTPRLGFRGNEDLGGGLKANFNLEAELLVTNGTAAPTSTTTLFSRAAWVSLSGNFGELKLGRQNTIAYDVAAKFDPMGAGNLGGIITTADSATATAGSGNSFNSYGNTRWDNAVQYYTPKVGGAQANVQYRIGGVAGDNAAGKGVSAGLHYAAGKFEASASYLAEYAASTSTVVTAANYNIAAGNKTFDHYGIYASYDFGVAKAIAGHTETKGAGVDGKAFVTDFVGAIVPLTGALSARVTYAAINNKDLGKKPEQYSAGLQYAMSKRTTLYTVYARAQQDGLTALNTASTSKFTNTTAVAGKDQSTVAVGVRHTF
jgi:predicted porin